MSEDLSPSQITELLDRFQAGDRSAYAQLAEATYEKVRVIARSFFRRGLRNHSLQSTELAGEVFIRLFNYERLGKHGGEFSSLLATTVRRVLIGYVRKRAARQRHERIKLELDRVANVPSAVDLIALNEALTKLERVSPRRYRIVQLRIFLAMTIEQIAELLAVGERTVRNDLKAAWLWLRHEMTSGEE